MKMRSGSGSLKSSVADRSEVRSPLTPRLSADAAVASANSDAHAVSKTAENFSFFIMYLPLFNAERRQDFKYILLYFSFDFNPSELTFTKSNLTFTKSFSGEIKNFAHFMDKSRKK